MVDELGTPAPEAEGEVVDVAEAMLDIETLAVLETELDALLEIGGEVEGEVVGV